MSTTNVTPPLPAGKKRKTYYVKKDSKELSDNQFAVHRITDDARISKLMTKPNADKECERLEKVSTGGGHVEPGNGKKRSRRVTLTSARLLEDVADLLRRELKPNEEAEVHASIYDAEHSDADRLTKTEYQEWVNEIVAHLKRLEAEEQSAAQALTDAANPPVERWTKEATELGTTLGARIGTFKAMANSVQQVNDNFSSLKNAIDAGKLPKTTRIMPDVEWKKTTKDGKHTTDQKGFVDFQDYCLVILKRGKSAVYQMLKDAKMPREKKDPDNSFGELVKRGAKSFVNMHKKLSGKDKEIGFDSFMESVVAAARAIMSAKLATDRKKADAAEQLAASQARDQQIQDRVDNLPPAQGQAG
jgi:hypothetical protein